MAPDWATWKRKKLWTLWEAACLTNRLEPPIGKSYQAVLAEIPEEARNRTGALYGHLKDAIDLRDLKTYGLRTLSIKDQRVAAKEFVVWLSKEGYAPVPPEMVDLRPNPAEKPVTEREKTTYLNIVGALSEDALGKYEAKVPMKSEAQLVEHRLEKYRGMPGMSKRTLEEKLAEAKRSLKKS